jgi:hypothetical protein
VKKTIMVLTRLISMSVNFTQQRMHLSLLNNRILLSTNQFQDQCEKKGGGKGKGEGGGREAARVEKCSR